MKLNGCDFPQAGGAGLVLAEFTLKTFGVVETATGASFDAHEALCYSPLDQARGTFRTRNDAMRLERLVPGRGVSRRLGHRPDHSTVEQDDPLLLTQDPHLDHPRAGGDVKIMERRALEHRLRRLSGGTRGVKEMAE